MFFGCYLIHGIRIGAIIAKSIIFTISKMDAGLVGILNYTPPHKHKQNPDQITSNP